MTDAAADLVERSVDDGIHVLRLARPPVNALDPALCRALREAVDAALAEGAAGLLAGGPKVFSAGLDVPYLVSLGDDRAALRSAWKPSSMRRARSPAARCRSPRRSSDMRPRAAACWPFAATIG